MTDEITQLKKEIEKLKEDNALKADLISISAHQLRTSLSAIKWVIKMVLDRDVGPLAPEQEGLLKKAFDSNERMIMLVSDLLNLNHAQDIVLGYTFEKVQIVDVIDNVLFEFMSETKKRNIEIIFLKPDTALPQISADKVKLRVVLQNLIENAIKYSKDGTKIFISLIPDGDGIKLSVKDNGIGIPESTKEHIFEKFYRLQTDTNIQVKGHGLGLYLSRFFARTLGGHLSIAETAEGATFLFSFPIKPKWRFRLGAGRSGVK